MAETFVALAQKYAHTEKASDRPALLATAVLVDQMFGRLINEESEASEKKEPKDNGL